jgi:hypothetical protein
MSSSVLTAEIIRIVFKIRNVKTRKTFGNTSNGEEQNVCYLKRELFNS